MSKLDLSGTGASYIRISDDKQDAERQRESIPRFLAKHQVVVRQEFQYEDIGWSRSDAAVRPDFQRMIADAEERRIQWIVVDRPDRFGASDKFELFSYLHRLHKAGCRLYTVDGRNLTSLDAADSIHTHLDADTSERELREKSIRVLEKMHALAKRGQWLGGRIPHGMDVVCFRIGQQMTPQWRVRVLRDDLKVKIEPDGSRREYHGTAAFPASEDDEVLQLRPGDPDQLAAVRWVMQRYADEAINFNALARAANELKLSPPAYAGEWDGNHVRRILSNPIYVGSPAWNRKTSGSYSEFSGGERREKRPNTPQREHAEADWVLADRMFEPVVDMAVWEKVQAKLKARTKRKLAPKSSAAWLSGLVYCARCGRKMSGSKNYNGRGASYLCSSYLDAHRKGQRSECDVNAVQHGVVEQYLRSYFAETSITLADLAAPAKLIGTKQVDAFKAAFDRAAATRAKMASLVGKNPNDDMLVQTYSSMFASERPRLQARLDQLKAQHSDIADAWRTAPTPRSKQKFEVDMVELETEITDLESRVANAADDLADAVAEVARLVVQWDQAAAALDTDRAARAKRQAVERVIEKVELTFGPTGMKRPAYALQTVRVVPVTRGPAPQAKEISDACSATRWS